MRRNRGGLSLLETVVVASILLLLVGILTVSLVRGARVWKKVENETTLLREVQTILREMERSISTGHPYGLTAGTNSIALLSCQDNQEKPLVNNRGEPVWNKFVIYYVDNVGLLRKRVLQLGTPSSEALSFEEETGQNLDQYLNQFPRQDDRRLTHSGRVTLMKLKSKGDYGSLYEINLEAEETVNYDRVDTLKLSTTIGVRN